ncbi:hypothetical protein NL676_012500 [Syzygium grande]|nr:hypothetical protein NL676_012500 [Syzygium grande]
MTRRACLSSLLSRFGVASAFPLSSSTAPSRGASPRQHWPRGRATVACSDRLGAAATRTGAAATGIGGWSTKMTIQTSMMPSISSGDEDSAKDRAGSRARGGASGGSRPGRDDNRARAGEEPDCWRRVDEDEVSSRW